MADEQTPAPEPDMISQVGEMQKRMASGNWIFPGAGRHYNYTEADERALLISAAILAVAAELRGVRNELMELRLELS